MLELGAAPAHYSDTLHLDLGSVVPSIAGPKRPQDRIPLDAGKATISEAIDTMRAASGDGVVEMVPDAGLEYGQQFGA